MQKSNIKNDNFVIFKWG